MKKLLAFLKENLIVIVLILILIVLCQISSQFNALIWDNHSGKIYLRVTTDSNYYKQLESIINNTEAIKYNTEI